MASARQWEFALSPPSTTLVGGTFLELVLPSIVRTVLFPKLHLIYLFFLKYKLEVWIIY